LIAKPPSNNLHRLRDGAGLRRSVHGGAYVFDFSRQGFGIPINRWRFVSAKKLFKGRQNNGAAMRILPTKKKPPLWHHSGGFVGSTLKLAWSQQSN
jgi:hypothetical protein